MYIVLDVGRDPPQRGEGGPTFEFWDPLLSMEWLKLETLNFAYIYRDGGSNENCGNYSIGSGGRVT